MKKIFVIALAILCVGCSPMNKKGLQTIDKTSAIPSHVLPTVCVDADNLTVRAGPGVSFGAVAWTKRGDVLAFSQTVGVWKKVYIGNTSGFINSNFTRMCKDGSVVPLSQSR